MPRPPPQKSASAPSDCNAGMCGWCGESVTEDAEEEYIEGTCNLCGTTPYHPDCVSKYLKVYGRSHGKSQAFWLKRPHLELATNRCPMGVLEQQEGQSLCSGFVTAAKLIKPSKPAPAPAAPAAPASRAKQGAPQKQQQPKPAAAQPAGLGPRSTKVRAAAPPRPAERPAQPMQQAVLRDRLGVMVQPAAVAGKRRPQLSFPGGVRPEELTLCRIWEAHGDCSVPSCVFAHSQEELEQREDEYRAQQAQRKKEQRQREQEARRAALEQAQQEAGATDDGPAANAPPSAAAASEAAVGGDAWVALPQPVPLAPENAQEEAVAAAGGQDVWASLVARARAAMPSAAGSGASSASGGATPSTPETAEQPAASPGSSSTSYLEEAAAAPSPSFQPYGNPPPSALPWAAEAPVAASPAAIPLPTAPLPASLPASLPAPAPAAAPAGGPATYSEGFQAGLQAAMAQLGLLHSGAAPGPALAQPQPQPEWQPVVPAGVGPPPPLGPPAGVPLAPATAAEPAGSVDWVAMLGHPVGGANTAGQRAPGWQYYQYNTAQQAQQESADSELDDMLALLCTT